MTKIILIRHGESEANKGLIFAGNYDADLTELGMAQAERAAEYVANNYKVDVLYSSDLKRASRTGEAVSRQLGLGINYTSKLREIDAGDWDGLTHSVIAERWREEYALWKNDNGRAGCPGGETVAQLADRVMSELGRIADENEGKTVAVAIHGNPVRAVVTMLMFGDITRIDDAPWINNASVTVIERKDGGWSLVTVGEDSYLGELAGERLFGV